MHLQKCSTLSTYYRRQSHPSHPRHLHHHASTAPQCYLHASRERACRCTSCRCSGLHVGRNSSLMVVLPSRACRLPPDAPVSVLASPACIAAIDAGPLLQESSIVAISIARPLIGLDGSPPLLSPPSPCCSLSSIVEAGPPSPARWHAAALKDAQMGRIVPLYIRFDEHARHRRRHLGYAVAINKIVCLRARLARHRLHLRLSL